MLVLAGVPYTKLDMPDLPELSSGARSEHIQHTLYKGMVLPMVVLTGLSVLIRRNAKKQEKGHDPEQGQGKEKGGDDHE
ncbi:hydrogenase 2 protein HybA [compost metagenome]